MHHGHTPEISVDGDTAVGLWYLGGLTVHLKRGILVTGSAIYENTFVKDDGRWKISRMGYTRRLEMREPLGDREITSRPRMADA